MISTIVSRLVILVFGTLYPAYASYKAVRTKNVKEYVKWMMYWIVFALFTCAETFTDVFLSWFPFYYEIKIILVLWLLSPATKGSSILYRKFVHPMLSRREQEIDEYIAKAKEQGYHTVLNLGTKGVNYATTVIMQTAIKGGGGIVNQLRRSYSLSDLTDQTDSHPEPRTLREHLEEDPTLVDPRRRRHSPRRSASGSNRVDMYFPEVDIRPGPSLSHVRSTEDVSSGYSSAEPLYVGQPPKLEPREGLVRTASVGGSTRPRARTTRTSVSTKKTTLPEDIEESESDSEKTIIQQKPITVTKNKRSSITSEDTDDSENSNDFVDSIGFPAEIIPKQTKKNSEILLEKNINETVKTTEEIIENQSPESSQKIEAICNVEINIVQESSEDISETRNEKSDSQNLNDKNNDEEIKICETETEKLILQSEKSLQNEDAISLVSNSQRGGKYNKHITPIPPSQLENISDEPINTSSKELEISRENSNNLVEKSKISELPVAKTESSDQNHPIKATLVLKPGIIKSLGPSSEETSQVFVSSPKLKRKSKHESPISRLMMLPKKIFGHKESSSHENLKRKSWHEDSRSSTPSYGEDFKSKSDTEDLYEPITFCEEKKSVSAAEINKKSKDNKIVLRTLSHSPKQYRRRRRNDDEDSD